MTVTPKLANKRKKIEIVDPAAKDSAIVAEKEVKVCVEPIVKTPHAKKRQQKQVDKAEKVRGSNSKKTVAIQMKDEASKVADVMNESDATSCTLATAATLAQVKA